MKSGLSRTRPCDGIGHRGGYEMRCRVFLIASALLCAVWCESGWAQVVVDLHGRELGPATKQLPPEAVLPTAQQLDAVEIGPELLGLVGQLDDPSYATREEAMKRLIESAREPLPLYAVLSREALTPEQRYRLLSVIRAQLVSLPRGAIGVSMQPVPANGEQVQAIRVVDVLPGLPAERVLQVGDLITNVDSAPVRNNTDLIFRVQSKRPGDLIRLTVRRPKQDENGQHVLDEHNLPVSEELKIEMELGSAELLQNRGGGSPFTAQLEALREMETNAARSTFSPAPRQIRLGNRASSFLDDVAKSISQEEIDEHPVVRAILQHRQLIAEGRIPLNEALRVNWRRNYDALVHHAKRHSLSESDQIFIQRVLERYLELMRE